jgi:hypothetical protein
MLFKETFAVYSENNNKSSSALSGQNTEQLSVNFGSTYIY